MTIFLPLARIWHIMEEKRYLIQENDDEDAAAHNGIVLISEATILLVGQTCNSLSYKRRLNILSTLIGNNTRVKEIPDMDMDSVDNMYLFKDKFDEKLSKVVTTINQNCSSPDYMDRTNKVVAVVVAEVCIVIPFGRNLCHNTNKVVRE